MVSKVSPSVFDETQMDIEQPDRRFNINNEDIAIIIDRYMKRKFCEDVDHIMALGGTNYLLDLLGVDPKQGLNDTEDNTDRIEQFGSNRRPEVKRKTFWELCVDAMKDLTLQILAVCGLVSLILGLTLDEHPEIGWIEGFAIMIAVVVVVLVTGTNDYQKEKKFAELQAQNQNRKAVSIIRNGEPKSMHPQEVLVGDIVELADGLLIPADGIMIGGSDIEIVEAAMTGENDPLRKYPAEYCTEIRTETLAENPSILDEVERKTQLEQEKADKGGNDAEIEAELAQLGDYHHEVPTPVCLSGTTLSEGRGQMLVLAVGSNSAEGRILDQVESEGDSTPLQAKLEKLAGDIGKLGLIAAVIVVMIVYLRFIIEIASGVVTWSTSSHPIELVKYLVLGITVLVVAIPEGLPLAVTISLAYSVKRMQKDNNLVRRLHACETMGGANMIWSDKTGTLTQNKMSVAQFFANSTQYDFEEEAPSMQTFKPEYFAILKETIWLNSTAFFDEESYDDEGEPAVKEIGSKTELALLSMLINLGHSDYKDLRKDAERKYSRIHPFSSKRKRSSIVIGIDENGDTKRAHVKGAAEVVLNRWTHFLDFDGNKQELSEEARTYGEAAIGAMADQALRCIGMAYRDLDEGMSPDDNDEHGEPMVESNGLTLICIAGIKDPIRPEVPMAVTECKSAHIKVRMVTGDNVATARAIAKECGIVVSDQSLIMEGSEFDAITGGTVCKKWETAECDCPRDSRSAAKDEDIREDVVKNINEFSRIIDRLDVLARSRPHDKYTLVTGLRQLGHVVAVTGDGTNDAPALKKADIGFAMGIAGTDMAKEAADIILLDDNFRSIVRAVMWGRNIYDNIRRFLQFQLTVNIVAVSWAIVGAASLKQSPLTAVQMLWVNLIMDTFASLALATEPPTEAHLKRKPHNRNEYIVSRIMWKHIMGQAVLQCILIFVMMFAGEWFLPEYGSGERVGKNADDDRYVVSGRLKSFDGTEDDYKEDYDDPDIGPSRHFTYIFNIFVLQQLFNEINSRKIMDELNVFEGLFRNPLFGIIWIGTIIVQILIVSFGGYAVAVHLDGLTWEQWFICIAFAITALPWRLLILFIPNKMCMKMGNEMVDPNAEDSVALSLRRASSRHNTKSLGSAKS